MEANKYLKKLTCLYVEDEDFIRETFFMMLKRYFKEVFIGTNGKEGLELYKKHNPDIVISDIRMPIMDGIEMAKAIKEIDPKSYIIFITAFSDNEYLKAAIDLGVEGYITKPVDRKKLLEKLNFLANVIKNEREKEELFELLKAIFDSQIEATILFEKNSPKLCNKRFLEEFKECINLDDLIKKFNIDLSKPIQKIEVKNHITKIYEIRIEKLSPVFTLILFNNITTFEDEILLDNLTEVYNRRYFQKIINKVTGSTLCTLMMDIDHFKKINDTYGHPKGDMVLKELAKILKTSLRKNDIIIRVGGEEFFIVLDNVDDIKTAYKIANHLRETIEKYSFEDIKVTCSFGVCCAYINSKEDFEKLYNKTDEALYQAKRNGRNRVEVYK
ncbi:MAG: diguanylate cyclase [Nautiliaceae bacterium]